jgi:leucyl/phenylalanyl-tRNA--protein transferase
MGSNSFPHLASYQDFNFPCPRENEDMVAVGGNLSPGMLLSAYQRGIFPWGTGCETEPIHWFSLNPRCVLKPENLHVSKSTKKHIKRNIFSIKLDDNFNEVITTCAQHQRSTQNSGSWINSSMISAYCTLHELGYAHSVSAYDKQGFAGGFYGIKLGAVFFGESMVSLRPNASKIAFIHFVRYFSSQGLKLIDCQQPSPHMLALGAELVPRNHFRQLLDALTMRDGATECWSHLHPESIS